MGKIKVETRPAMYQNLYNAFIGEVDPINVKLYTDSKDIFNHKSDVNFATASAHSIDISCNPGLLNIYGDGGSCNKIFNMFIYDGELVMSYYDETFADICFLKQDGSYVIRNEVPKHIVIGDTIDHTNYTIAKSSQVIARGDKLPPETSILKLLSVASDYRNKRLYYMTFVNTISDMVRKEFLSK